ncbi:hypothetical protein HDU67_007493 [Dinochytrium kinnereticum]|nr:hypothetical protein HDU67_007493 [Dinochytrium kinnereticum]
MGGLDLEISFPEDGIFFAGDSFACLLTFTNSSQEIIVIPSDDITALTPHSPSAQSRSPRASPVFLAATPLKTPSASGRSQDDMSLKDASRGLGRISFTQMVRKSISMSSLRTIIPLGTARKNSIGGGGEDTARKPFLGSVGEGDESEHESPPYGHPPILSVNNTTSLTSPNPNNLLSPSVSKVPKLTGVPPPPTPTLSSLKLPISDVSHRHKTPPVTPTTLPKNPLNDAPLRSLSIDMPRHAHTTPPLDISLANSPSEDPAGRESEQIQLSNVDDFDRASSRLSVISVNSAMMSPRPAGPDRSASPIPFPDSPQPVPSRVLIPPTVEVSSATSPQVVSVPPVGEPTVHAPPAKKFGVKTEDLAWAFAQMTGQMTVDASFVKTAALEPLKTKVMYNVGGAGPGGGGSMGGSGLGPDSYSKPQERVFPLYSTPPSILFYDLSLEPGESKSFKYELKLPSELPPTHRGKIIRFSYKLIVGIQRSGTSKRSQVIQLPFRLFGKVEGDGSKIVYEILNPVIINTEEAIITPIEKALAFPKPARSMNMHDDEQLTLMQNLTLICQRSGKLSFDICKNNEHVAQLKLTRGLYRLGETITGILDFSKSSIPCFQVSAFLENSETVDAPFAIKPKAQLVRSTRRVFAEQHRYTVNVCRTGISLPIPLGCTPDFKTTAVSLSWVLRLEFITGLSTTLLTPAASDVNFVHLGVMNHADVEAFDCLIPLKVFPTKMARRAVVKQFEILPPQPPTAAAPPATTASTRNQDSSVVDFEAEELTKLTSEQLTALGESEAVAKRLKSDALMTLLRAIDSSDDPEKLLEKALQESDEFQDFANEALAAVHYE